MYYVIVHCTVVIVQSGDSEANRSLWSCNTYLGDVAQSLQVIDGKKNIQGEQRDLTLDSCLGTCCRAWDDGEYCG